MDFNLTPEEEAFKADVVAFLDAHLPAEEQRDDMFLLRWNKLAREKCWVGFGWPKSVGGGGASVMEQAILKEELARRRAPALGTCIMGLAWVGPAIITYGTDAQKEKFIPDILDGKYQWCTGYSEPAVGSDLGALQCKAVREGDEYVVNGQKIWTSLAPWAKWMILLVRTSNDGATKHDGITCLLVEMDSPGIDVRPIMDMAGHTFFSEVFFDNVRVPAENLLGQEGQGWGITVSALANERSGISEVTSLLRRLDDLKRLAKERMLEGRPAQTDQATRRQLAEFETKITSMRMNGLRFLTKQVKGEPLGSETSINKLHAARLEQDMAEFGTEMQGSYGALSAGSDASVWRGHFQKQALGWGTTVIGGGTPNVQKNIIAERILGLPRD